MQAQAAVKVGDTAPNLTLPSLTSTGEGAPANLADLRGKVVYVDFWASWCGPCRLSFPQLEVIYQDLQASGFEIYAVNVDEFIEDAQGFLEQKPVSYPLVRDASGEAPARYGILGMPTAYLLDRNGVVRLIHQGYRKSDGDKLRAEIEHLLQEPAND